MFLSKLTLNPQPSCRQVQRDLASPYEMHRTILRAFPDRADGGTGRVLFRVEPSGDDQPPVVLVQSDKEPDWASLAAVPGYLLRPAQVKQFELRLRPAQHLRFRLRANPTVKKMADEKPKRLGLVKEADQLAWLSRKATAAGFLPVDAVIRRAAHMVSKSSKGTQTHMAVDFEGVLEVVDPQLLATAVASGIGAAKGFGFGLLSLAPV